MAIPEGVLAVAGPLIATYADDVQQLAEALPPTAELRTARVVAMVGGYPYTVRQNSRLQLAWLPVPYPGTLTTVSVAPYEAQVAIDPTVPASLSIADTGDPLTIQLFRESFTGGARQNVPFITTFEGTVQVHGDLSDGAAYDFTMAFKHILPVGGREFTARRKVRTRITPNNWYTLQLSAFNSVSVIGLDYETDSGETHQVEQGILDNPIVGEMYLEITAIQNDGSTRVARELQEIEFDSCGVFFEQRREQPSA